MIDSFLADLRDTGVLEALAVVLGLAYSVLAVRRNRLCWIAGGTSSAILVYLFARQHLPMQSILQVYYVGMSIYGFWHWTRQGDAAHRPVSTWPLRAHALAWLAILGLSTLSAGWLARETQAAWPFIDSAVAWASVLATWFVARVKIENWLYWIATDAVLVFLSLQQGLAFVAFLYLGYLCIAAVGFVPWLRVLRGQQAPAAAAT
jgi:nicotinamide mononucleotide transporter